MGSQAERPSETYLRNLIFSVCHLCDRTRDLAKSGSRDPASAQPVRDAMEVVRATLDALCDSWTGEVPAALPVDGASGTYIVDGWPLDGGDVLGIEDGSG